MLKSLTLIMSLAFIFGLLHLYIDISPSSIFTHGAFCFLSIVQLKSFSFENFAK